MKAAIANQSISYEELKECIDDFQQALFAIGAAMYQQASSEEDIDELTAGYESLLLEDDENDE